MVSSYPAGWVLYTVVFVMLFAVVGLYLPSFSKKTTVSGVLVPLGGVVKIYPVKTGVVSSIMISEGDSVQKGQSLVLLSGDSESVGVGRTHAAVSNQLEEKIVMLKDDLSTHENILHIELKEKNARANHIRAQMAGFKIGIKIQAGQVSLAKADLARFEALLSGKYASVSEVEGRRSALLAEKARLEQFIADQAALEQQNIADDLVAEKALLDRKNRISELRRQIADSVRELALNEGEREIRVSAPVSGRISAMLVSVGEVTTPLKPLMIMHKDSDELVAELHVPNASIGRIAMGDRVVVRYHAFPYQKHGNYKGNIVAITKVPISLSELDPFIESGALSLNTETYFRVRVRLDSQAVMVKGDARVLQSGLRLDADVIHEEIKLYEWLFEPLIGVLKRGKVVG